MKNQILAFCRNKIDLFSHMTDIDIYNYICENFFIENFTEARECSFIIFKESQKEYK